MAPTTRTGERPTLAGRQNDLDDLRAQRKLLDEQIEEAEAAMPKQTPLDTVIARQAERYGSWVVTTLAARTRERTKAGQPEGQALREVAGFFVAKAAALLAAAAAAAPAPGHTVATG